MSRYSKYVIAETPKVTHLHYPFEIFLSIGFKLFGFHFVHEYLNKINMSPRVHASLNFFVTQAIYIKVYIFFDKSNYALKAGIIDF